MQNDKVDPTRKRKLMVATLSGEPLEDFCRDEHERIWCKWLLKSAELAKEYGMYLDIPYYD